MKCPKCDKPITGVQLHDIIIGTGPYHEKGTAYSCPDCNAVLSVIPHSIQSHVETTIKKEVQRLAQPIGVPIAELATEVRQLSGDVRKAIEELKKAKG